MKSIYATSLRAVCWSGLSLVLGLAVLQAADANPPERMTYQGYLVDADGNALGVPNPRNYDVVFRLWKSESSTASSDLLWTEQQTVTVDQGYFSVLLGEGSAVGSEPRPPLSTVFVGNDASDRWLGITVKSIGAGGADADILPRLRLMSAPYAFLAAHAVEADQLVNGSSQQVVAIQDTKVGINTASPEAALDVNGGLKVRNDLAVGGNVTATGTLSAAQVTATRFAGYGVIPIGGIIMWSGSTVPDGWALCDGGVHNGVQTPDLRNRFIVGAGGEYGVGNRGGEKYHTLTYNEMPSHHHGYDDAYFIEAFPGTVIDNNILIDRNVSGNGSAMDQDNHYLYARRELTAYAGGGQPHENRPPYYALAFIMRVK